MAIMLYTFGCEITLRPRWSATAEDESSARAKAARSAGVLESELTLEGVEPVPEAPAVTHPARAYYNRYSAYEDGE